MKLTQEEIIRREKVAKLREAGIQPYADSFEKTHTAAEAGKLTDGETKVKIAGRILMMRLMGKLAFVRISDQTGSYQIILQQDELGEAEFKLWSKQLDLGDFVGASGKTFTTKHGEKIY